jgi:hypothetical protein
VYTNFLMLFREIIYLYYENYTKPVNTLLRQNTELPNAGVAVRVATTLLYRLKDLVVTSLMASIRKCHNKLFVSLRDLPTSKVPTFL